MVDLISGALSVSLDDWAARDRAARLRLFVPEARTRSASTLLAIGHALRSSLDPELECTVRDARASFWTEEIARCAQGNARHPLTVELQSIDPPVDLSSIAVAFLSLQQACAASKRALTSVLDALGELEAALWFGARAPDAEACRIRALCDFAEWGAGPNSALQTLDFDTSVIAALRAAVTRDEWTAARREQILRSPGAQQASGIASRMRERLDAWAIWRAVRAARRRLDTQPLTGADSGH